MACCVLGAVIFGTLFALWGKIKALFGLKSDEVNHVANWTLADQQTSTPTSPAPRPFIAPRMAAILLLISLTAGGSYFLIAHGNHMLSEVSCYLDSSEAACHHPDMHQHH